MMSNEALCAAYWQKYIAEQVYDVDHNVHYKCWHFGDTETMAEELALLIKQGIKTATSSLLWK